MLRSVVRLPGTFGVLVAVASIVLGVTTGSFVTAQESLPAIQPDVVYGHKDGLAMTFDVFRPSAKNGMPANGAAIAFMVSGGWFSRWAPPEQLRGLFQPYLDAGYTVFAVRHGSSPVYGIPDAVADVRRAIRYIRLNAKALQIDPDRIGAMGMSAGGHLTLMLATTGDDGDASSPDPVLRTSDRIAAAAALVPPSDLRVAVWESEDSLPAYKNFPALNLSLKEAAEYSPRLFVTADDAPALIVSGTLDELVPPRHGEWIAEAYEKADVDHQLLLLEANHGLQGKMPEAVQAIIQWFNEHLQPKTDGAGAQ